MSRWRGVNFVLAPACLVFSYAAASDIAGRYFERPLDLSKYSQSLNPDVEFARLYPSHRQVVEYLGDATIAQSDDSSQSSITYFAADGRVVKWFADRMIGGAWTSRSKLMYIRNGSRHRWVVVQRYCYVSAELPDDGWCVVASSLEVLPWLHPDKGMAKVPGNPLNLSLDMKPPFAVPKDDLDLARIAAAMAAAREAGR